MHRESNQLRLRLIWRKEFHFPEAQIVNQTTNIELNSQVFYSPPLIVVEQVENQCAPIRFATQLAQHVCARLQSKARPPSSRFGTAPYSCSRLCSPYDHSSACSERSQPRFCSGVNLGRSAGMTSTLNRSRLTPLSRCVSTLVSKITLSFRNSSASRLCGSDESSATLATDSTSW